MTFQFIPVPNHVESTAQPATYTTNWKAVGSSSQTYVHSFTLGATPGIVSTIYGTLYRQDIRVRQIAYNHFTVQVPYGTRKNETGEWTWDFDTTGGTVHITHAKEEVAKFPTATAPTQKGSIGVKGDEVQGVDIVIPMMKINVNFRHPFGVITLSQAKFLSSITGTVNSTPFLTFAPGEVLFLGARGADGTDANAQVNYQFAMSANVSGQTIGDIADVAKKGHEVIWTTYEDAIETVSSVDHPIKKPKFIYVDRVYDTIDMATALGFGS